MLGGARLFWTGNGAQTGYVLVHAQKEQLELWRYEPRLSHKLWVSQALTHLIENHAC